MEKSMHRFFLLAVIVSLTMLVSSCSGIGGDPKKDDYFKGTDGWEVTFLPNSPPPQLYYEADGNIEDNSFDIELELRNKGASLGWGAIFISGYDPNMIHVAGVEALPNDWKDCVFDIASLVSGGSRAYANCFGVEYFKDSNAWEGKINDVGNLLRNVPGWENSEILEKIDEANIDLNFGEDQAGTHVGFSLDNPFAADFDYFNRGKRLVLAIASWDIDFFNGQEYVLAADDYTFPGGGIEYPTFHASIKEWPAGVDSVNQPLLITSCYAYTTFAAPNVCIDTNPYSQDRKVCFPNTISFSGSNGAPVAITSVEQEASKNKALFTIHVSNVGNGRIFDLGYLSTCNPYNPHKVTEKNLDVVYLADARIGRDHLDCESDSRRIKLFNGEGVIRCSYDYRYASSKNAYETPLVLELWYGYSETIQRNVRIKRIG